MKVSNFNEDRCRELLSLSCYSVIYEKGKEYFEKQEPGRDDYFYQECTTRWVIKRCKDIWYYDHSGWIRDEERALDEFLERVEKGRELKVEEKTSAKEGWLLFLGIFLFFGVIYLLAFIIEWIIGLFS